MGERKVLNKYYPPDFDPSAIPRRKRAKSTQVKIRMMLPMSIRCNTCGEYLYKGKKFNSRKETVQDQDYLGLKIYRFYMKCTRCSAEFTIKTDPRNSDYLCELNCSRNFEPWKDHDKGEEEKEKEMEELDAMKMLENKTLEAKAEMDNLDDLDELRTMNSQNQKLSFDELLLTAKQRALEHQRQLEEEEEKLTAEEEAKLESFMKKQASSDIIVKRIRDDDDEHSSKEKGSSFGDFDFAPTNSLLSTPAAASSSSSGGEVNKKRSADDANLTLLPDAEVKLVKKNKKKKAKRSKTVNALSILASYGDDE